MRAMSRSRLIHLGAAVLLAATLTGCAELDAAASDLLDTAQEAAVGAITEAATEAVADAVAAAEAAVDAVTGAAGDVEVTEDVDVAGQEGGDRAQVVRVIDGDTIEVTIDGTTAPRRGCGSSGWTPRSVASLGSTRRPPSPAPPSARPATSSTSRSTVPSRSGSAVCAASCTSPGPAPSATSLSRPGTLTPGDSKLSIASGHLAFHGTTRPP